jgi:choriolysin L
METFGLPYDYKSIMHYPRNAFAKRGANYTMVAKVDPQMELGQHEAPTFNDWEKVRRMYFCEDTTNPQQVVNKFKING